MMPVKICIALGTFALLLIVAVWTKQKRRQIAAGALAVAAGATVAGDLASARGRDGWLGIQFTDAMLFLLVMIIHAAYAVAVKAPIIQGDEAGYLMNAAALAGYKGAAYSSYYPGYSLFLVPAFWLSSNPSLIYGYVRVINAILWGVIAVICSKLYLILVDKSKSNVSLHCFVVPLLVTSYPSFLVFSSLAVSENAIILCAIACAWSLCRTDTNGYLTHTLLALCAGGLAFIVHPTGISVVFAVISAVLLFAYLYNNKFMLSGCAIIVVMACTAIFFHLLRLHLKASLNYGEVGLGGHYPTISGFLRGSLNGLNVHHAAKLAREAAGQLLYLTAATAGLCWLGLAWCITNLRARRRKPLVMYAMFTLMAVGAMFVISVVGAVGGDRADHKIYGRYNEGVLILLILPALIYSARRWVLYSGCCVAGLCAVILLARWGITLPGALVLTNIAGIGGMVQLSSAVYPVQMFALALIGLLVICDPSLRIRTRYGLIAVLFIAQAWLVAALYLVPGSRFRAQQHQVASYAKTVFPAVHCINYDEGATGFWEKYNYRFFLLPDRIHAVNAPFNNLCSGLIISARGNMPHYFPDAVMLREEYGSNEVLWATSRAAAATNGRVGTHVTLGTLYTPGNGLARLTGDGSGVGWYRMEPWGIWSRGSASVFIRLPATAPEAVKVTLRFRVYAADAEHPKHVRISSDGVPVADMVVSTPDSHVIAFPIVQPKGTARDGSLIILMLRSSDAVSPHQLGKSIDGRVLGVGLESLVVSK